MVADSCFDARNFAGEVGGIVYDDVLGVAEPKVQAAAMQVLQGPEMLQGVARKKLTSTAMGLSPTETPRGKRS